MPMQHTLLNCKASIFITSLNVRSINIFRCNPFFCHICTFKKHRARLRIWSKRNWKILTIAKTHMSAKKRKYVQPCQTNTFYLIQRTLPEHYEFWDTSKGRYKSIFFSLTTSSWTQKLDFTSFSVCNCGMRKT